jgi:trimethyllysine dioxygenase
MSRRLGRAAGELLSHRAPTSLAVRSTRGRRHSHNCVRFLNTPRSGPTPSFSQELSRKYSLHSVRLQQSVASPRPLQNTVSWDADEKEISISFSDSPLQVCQFPYLWLRDHCLCSECTHPHTKQRQINTFEIPQDISISSIEPSDEGLLVQWSDTPHQSCYSWHWLQENNPISSQVPMHRKWHHVKPSLDHSKYPTTSHEDITNSTLGLARWLSQIRTHGFAFVSDVPATPEATEKLLNCIAFIRPTHYGGFWDFTSQLKPTDTAYTNLGLPNHTDSTYFTDPCGLQMFHVLQPATGGGGESTLVDGFAAAEYLYYSDSAAYHSLSTTPIVSHASGNEAVGSIDNTAVSSLGYPVLNHDPSTISPLERPSPESLTQIRWNNDDRHSRTRWPSRRAMDEWYDAARKWNEILTLPEFEIEIQLQPGTPVIFDNQRVLHGRRAFEGERRVCGGYIGMDDFLARLEGVTNGMV